jgi:hypothetical protein
MPKPDDLFRLEGAAKLRFATLASSINSRRQYLLAELHCAALRARLWQADIKAVGLALKSTLITPDQALELLHDCDVLRLVGLPREAKQ